MQPATVCPSGLSQATDTATREPCSRDEWPGVAGVRERLGKGGQELCVCVCVGGGVVAACTQQASKVAGALAVANAEQTEQSISGGQSFKNNSNNEAMARATYHGVTAKQPGVDVGKAGVQLACRMHCGLRSQRQCEWEGRGHGIQRSLLRALCTSLCSCCA